MAYVCIINFIWGYSKEATMQWWGYRLCLILGSFARDLAERQKMTWVYFWVNPLIVPRLPTNELWLGGDDGQIAVSLYVQRTTTNSDSSGSPTSSIPSCRQEEIKQTPYISVLSSWIQNQIFNQNIESAVLCVFSSLAPPPLPCCRNLDLSG